MTKTGFLISTTALSTALGLVLSATTAQTAGYAIKETSATQVGQAFAGAGALKGDVSSMWNNPATMTTLSGNHVAVAGNLILPSAKFKDNGSTALVGGNGGNGGKKALVPALHAVYSLNEKVKLGLSLAANFGLATEYSDDWKGRYTAVKSEMKSLNINPNFAYKVNDYVSFGLGVSAQYIKVDLTKKLYMPLGAADGHNKVTGDDWAAGFNVGALFTPWEGGRIGVAYRSKISHTLKGDSKTSGITGVGVGIYGLLNVANGTTKVDADMTTPETIDFSYAQDLGDAWTVLASAVWTRWSRFKKLEVKNKSGGTVGLSERQGWKNVWFFALGANWKVADNWMLRAGVAYDKSPISDTHRTAKLPGNDRTWLSAGVDWKFADWGKVALTYTHIFIKDGKIDNTDAFDHNLKGKMKNKVDIIGLQANFKF